MWMSEGGVDLPPKFDKKYSRPRAYPHNGRARKATLYIRTSSCLANRCVAAACVRKIERDEMRSFSVQQIDAERSREPERAGRTEERGTFGGTACCTFLPVILAPGHVLSLLWR